MTKAAFHPLKNDKEKTHTHTQAQAEYKLLHCTEFASYSKCQRGWGCYFTRTEPPGKELNANVVVM